VFADNIFTYYLDYLIVLGVPYLTWRLCSRM